MGSNIPKAHQKMILDALATRDKVKEASDPERLNLKLMHKVKDSSFEAYHTYRDLKYKMNMLMDFVDMFKGE